MTFDVSVVVGGLVVGAVGLLQWLLLRGVRGVDSKLEGLQRSVDKLNETDTRIQVELAEVRVRITHLEHLVMGGGRQQEPAR